MSESAEQIELLRSVVSRIETFPTQITALQQDNATLRQYVADRDQRIAELEAQAAERDTVSEGERAMVAEVVAKVEAVEQALAADDVVEPNPVQ